MQPVALIKFESMSVGAEILKSHVGEASHSCSDQNFIDQTCCKAAVALAVGCWEGYLEAVMREFVSKVRVQAHRRTWSLIAQFEAIVDKKVSSLNTPNWEKSRELLMEVTGMDPYASWVWLPKFTNPTDTKTFFDGILSVRHAFAHGFEIPVSLAGLAFPGVLDVVYVHDSIECIRFFARKTDELLRHELMHRHNCQGGWS